MVLNKITTLGFAVALLATTFSAHAMEEFQPENKFQQKLLAMKQQADTQRSNFNLAALEQLRSLESICRVKITIEKDKTAKATSGLDAHSLLTEIQTSAETCHQSNLRCLQMQKEFEVQEKGSKLKSLERRFDLDTKGWESMTPDQQAGEEKGYQTEMTQLSATIKNLKAQIVSDELFYERLVTTIAEEHEIDLEGVLTQAREILRYQLMEFSLQK